MARNIPPSFLLMAAAGGLAYWWWQQNRDPYSALDNVDLPDEFNDDVNAMLSQVLTGTSWRNNPVWQRLAPTIQAAAMKFGIPDGLLDALLYQESHYRPDIISGQTRSRTGATGIAQFEPQTAAEFGIDPTDPNASIYGAAQYLAQLYGEFSSWPRAVAAYDWGPGNVKAWVNSGGAHPVPKETLNYVSAITGTTLA